MSTTKSYPAGLKEIQSEDFELELIVQPGDVITKRGVLVPEANYRFYDSQMKQNKILENTLKDCIDTKIEVGSSEKTAKFWEGAAVGVLTVLLGWYLLKP